jgi:uncharacterized repeat protein (TIGR01451 family)
LFSENFATQSKKIRKFILLLSNTLPMRISTTTLFIISFFWTGFTFAQCDTEVFCAPRTINCNESTFTYGCEVIGNGPFTFVWSNMQEDVISPDSLVTISSPGTYILEVTDLSGCADTVTVEIEEDILPPDCAISVINNTSCTGGPTLLSVDCSSTSSLIYTWQRDGVLISTEQEITVTVGGLYCVDVTSEGGCTYTDCVLLPDPPGIIEADILITNRPRCDTDGSGRIHASVDGGTPPYTYLWSDGSTDNSLIDQFIGTYSVTVIDAYGCEASATDSLTISLELDAGEDQVVYCEDSTILTANTSFWPVLFETELSITDDIMPISFTSEAFPLEVETSNGFIGNNSIPPPPPQDPNALYLKISSGVSQPGELGCIQVTVDNFFVITDMSFTINFDPNILTLPYISNINPYVIGLAEGQHINFFTTPDEGYIIVNYTTPIPGFPSTLDNGDPIFEVCFHVSDDIGELDPTLNLEWTGPDDFLSAGNTLSTTVTDEGIYNVRFIDTSLPNCWVEDEIEVSFIDSLYVEIGADTLLYCEDVLYSLNNQLSGGEGNYDYLWSTGETSSSISISPSAGDLYYLTVTDAGGCVGIDSVVMQPAPPFLIEPQADQFLCEGDSYVIFPLIQGGLPPYVSAEWNTGAISPAIGVNTTGLYSLTVTDQNGCTATQDFNVEFTPTPIIDMPAQHNICSGGSVTLEPDVSGDTPPFIYQWSTGENTPTITVAPPNMLYYSLTVTDANGCTSSTFTQVLVNNLTAFPSPPLCDDGGTPSDPSDDAFFVEAYFTGGAPSGWIATSPTGTQSGAYGVPAIFGPFLVQEGDVNIQVVDAENPGCNLILPVSVPGCFPVCDMQVEILNENCDFGGTPSDPTDDVFTIDVIVTGTNTSTSWIASNGMTGSYDQITTFGPFSLQGDPINIIFTDSEDANCSATLNISPPTCDPDFCAINTSISSITCDDNDTPSDGTDDLYTITFFASSAGSNDSFQLTLLNETYIGAYFEPLIIATSLVEGNSYDAEVVDNENPDCTDLLSFTAPACIDPCEDSDLIITLSTTDATCFGLSDGCISVEVTGGTPPYLYQWDVGGTIINTDLSDFCDLTAGDYFLTVTDANGCTESIDVIISEPPLLDGFIVEVQAPTCETSFDGILQIDMIGGTPPYEYIWATGELNQQISGLAPGIYTITVVDANDCMWTGQYQLTPEIFANAGPDQTINCVNATVTLDGSGSSVGPDLIYEWIAPDGSITQDVSVTVNLVGTYQLVVTNTAEPNCSSTDEVTVTSDIVDVEVGYNLISCDSANLFYTPFLPDIIGDWTYPDGSTAPATPLTGTIQTGTHYLDIIDTNSGCTYIDSIFVNVDPSNCVSLAGRLVRDTLEDCIPMLDEPGLCNWLIVIEGANNTFYAVTQADGYYEQDVPAGTYEVYPLIPSGLWLECDDSYTVSLDTPGDMAMLDIPVQEQEACPDLSVDFSLPLLRRCWTRSLFVNYCNNGTAIAEDAYVEVTLDDAFTYQSATAPLIDQDGQTFTFDVGDVAINQCGNFKITFVVSCDVIVGESLCAEAKIFPNTPCEVIDPLWSGASLSVTSECEEDQVRFRVENMGTGDMDLPSACIVIEDGLMLFVVPDSLRLDAGAFYDYEFPANGSTYRLEIEQAPFHPGFSQPTVVIEGCGGDDFGGFSTGFVNQLPFDDTNDFIDIECREVVGSYDPNDKHGFPRGYGDENFIYPGTEIEYLVNFQNTGNDTAFLVVIRDTLSEHLDIASVRPGGASHAYTWDIDGDDVLVFTFENILLPDSTTNLEESQGFIEFKVAQRADLPLGTVIENSAAIYFDINEPIITNTTDHKLGKDFIEVINLTIDKKLKGATVQVVPNPAQEEAVFDLNGWSEGEKTFELIDTRGRLITQQTFNGSSFSFQRGSLSSGLYFFRIMDAERYWAVGKIQLY